MGKKLSELTEAITTAITDIFHLRTVGGIDKKIKGDNLIKTILPLILTTKGDLPIRGTTDAERLVAGALDTYFKGQGAGALPIYEKLTLRDTGIKIDSLDRSVAGNQVITGVGFKPSIIFITGGGWDYVGPEITIGFDDSVTHLCMYKNYLGNSFIRHTSYSVYLQTDATNILAGAVSALSTDGFTITWTLTGAARVSRFIYLALP